VGGRKFYTGMQIATQNSEDKRWGSCKEGLGNFFNPDYK